jgi:hypothetical protein
MIRRWRMRSAAGAGRSISGWEGRRSEGRRTSSKTLCLAESRRRNMTYGQCRDGAPGQPSPDPASSARAFRCRRRRNMTVRIVPAAFRRNLDIDRRWNEALDRRATRLPSTPHGREQRRLQGVGVVLPDVQGGLPELVRQETEAGNISGPAEAGGREMLNPHLDRVAGLGPVDMDRASDGVDLAGVEGQYVGDGCSPGRVVPPSCRDTRTPGWLPVRPSRRAGSNDPTRNDDTHRGWCSRACCTSLP